MKKQEFLDMLEDFAKNGLEDDDTTQEEDQNQEDTSTQDNESDSETSPDDAGEDPPAEGDSDDDDAGTSSDSEESQEDSAPKDDDARSKIHKLNKENQTLRKRAKEAEQKLLRQELPKKVGVPAALSDWVRGGTKEEIEADAKKLTEALKSLAKGGGRSFFDGLNQDTRGTKPDDEADLDKIGARIYKR